MLKFLARLFLKIARFEVVGERPTERRYVLIGAPHTSNWDLAYFLSVATVLGLKVSWMGKHTLFRPPMGWFMRRLGGIEIDRRQRGDVVARMAALFEGPEPFVLVMAAEGTRKHVTHWKSGFYHIARAADVPIVLGFLDFTRRCGGMGPALRPTGDIGQDMDRIRAFYAGMTGRNPDQGGVVRLKEELEGGTPSSPSAGGGN